MLKMQKSTVTDEMFDRINGVLFEADDEKVTEIIVMLDNLDEGYEKNPRQKLLSYFSKLWAFIRHEEKKIEEALEVTFEGTLKEFKKWQIILKKSSKKYRFN